MGIKLNRLNPNKSKQNKKGLKMKRHSNDFDATKHNKKATKSVVKSPKTPKLRSSSKKNQKTKPNNIYKNNSLTVSRKIRKSSTPTPRRNKKTKKKKQNTR